MPTEFVHCPILWATTGWERYPLRNQKIAGQQYHLLPIFLGALPSFVGSRSVLDAGGAGSGMTTHDTHWPIVSAVIGGETRGSFRTYSASSCSLVSYTGAECTKQTSRGSVQFCGLSVSYSVSPAPNNSVSEVGRIWSVSIFPSRVLRCTPNILAASVWFHLLFSSARRI